jgi:hypothetical protein
MPVSTKERIKLTPPAAIPATRRSSWHNSIGFVLYLAVAIAFLEGIFRIAGIGQQEFLQPDPQMGCRHIPNKVVTWRLEGYSCDRLNSDGLRDSEHTIKKAPGVFRIALLGDSATEALQVNMNETYGKVLEARLNKKLGGKSLRIGNRAINRFEVINFGCSAYSTGQELLEYRNHVCKYNPDSVVLLFNRGDTTENCLNLTAKDFPEPRPYFFLDQAGAPQTDSTVLKANSEKLAPNPLLDFLRARSRIYGVFSQANLSLSLTDSRYRKFRAWLDRTTAQIKGEPPRSTTRLGYPQQDGLKVTTALIKALAREVKANSQSFVLVIFPNMGHDPYFSSQVALLQRLANTEQLGYLDLTAAFLDSPRLTENFLWYHFSPTGHRLVAERLLFNFRTSLP